MSEFVTVNCKIPNGIVLRTYEKSEGPFGLVSDLEKDRVTLKGGDNEVDSAFFDKWLEANSDSELFTKGYIERLK